MISPHPWLSGSLLVLIAASLVGCTVVPAHVDAPIPEAKIVAYKPSDAEQLLTYVLRARMLSPAEFALEKDRVRAEFAAEKSNQKRVKLAILMALSPPVLAPAAAVAEDAEFQALVEPLAFSGSLSPASTEPALRAIATLLQSMAQDRKRLRDQLRDVVARSQATRREEANAQAEARILRIQVEDLEKKLNALKSIERSVTSRSAEGSVK